MTLAAFLCCVISFVWSFVRSGYGELAFGLLVLFFVIRLVSSVVFCDVICKVVADRLAGTGLLKGYALGRSHE